MSFLVVSGFSCRDAACHVSTTRSKFIGNCTPQSRIRILVTDAACHVSTTPATTSSHPHHPYPAITILSNSLVSAPPIPTPQHINSSHTTIDVFWHILLFNFRHSILALPVKFILFPCCRIIFNICSNAVIFFLVSDDMVMKTFLPSKCDFIIIGKFGGCRF